MGGAAAAAAGRPPFPRFLLPLPGEPSHREGKAALRWGRCLLLTFDDGPDLVGTSLILDELNRRGLRAIFFVNGNHIVRDRPEDLARRNLLRKLATHGNLVGNHSMSHKNLCQLAREERRERSNAVQRDEPGGVWRTDHDSVAAEIDDTSEIIADATSVRPLLFRSPYGARCRALDRALADRDLIQVGWNVDPQEWRGEDEDAIVRYTTAALRRARGPVILLLHDRNLAAVHALSRILDFVDAENARAAHTGMAPIRLVDYRVLLPHWDLPETGLGPLARSFATPLGALGRLRDRTAGSDGGPGISARAGGLRRRPRTR